MTPPARRRKPLPRPRGEPSAATLIHILRLGKAFRADGLGPAELAALAHGPPRADREGG